MDLRHCRIEFEKEYGIDIVEGDYSARVSTTTKFMILPEYRGSILTIRFAGMIYDFWRDQDIAFDFINVNEPLEKFYETLGYRRYIPNFTHPEFGEVMPMVMVVNDVEYLRKVGSPFIGNGREYTGSLSDGVFLKERFPGFNPLRQFPVAL
jgi:hypothetical protein